jgi:aminoglycoside 6-adenylyltransferase
VIKDEIDISLILENIENLNQIQILSKNDFVNIVNDFWFHCVWTAKKIMRGELLTAKSCLDIYMKQLLLIMIENYILLVSDNCDVWYRGRFIEKWAENWIIEKLKISYSKYDKQDMIETLYVNMELFSVLAKKVAGKQSFPYPGDAEAQSYNIVNRFLDKKGKLE